MNFYLQYVVTYYSEEKKSSHPKWALKHKKPGTELHYIRGRYYLYEYKTVYEKEKKRAKKYLADF